MANKILVITVLSLLVLGGVKFSLGAVEGIVAIVNDEVITQKDIDEFTSMMYLQHADEYKDRKGLEEEVAKWRKEAVEAIIEDRLIVQEAKKKKMIVEPVLVEGRLAEMKNQFADSEEFEKTIASEGLTINDLKRKTEEQILMRKIVEAEVKDKITVTPSEITVYYEGHKAEIVEPELFNIDSIFIPFKDSAENAGQKAEGALAALKAGEEFSAVAKKYSDTPSIGKIAKGQLKKEIEEAILKLKKGEISGIVKTENGLYIFKLLENIPTRQLTLKETQEQIYRIIFAEKFEKKFTSWTEDLRKKAYLNVK